MRKIGMEIDERLKKVDLRVKDITFDKKRDNVLTIRITKSKDS